MRLVKDIMEFMKTEVVTFESSTALGLAVELVVGR